MNQGQGVYKKMRIVDAKLGRAKTQTEQVAVLLEAANKETDTWYGYLTDATCDKTFENLRVGGWVGDDLSDLSSMIGNWVDVLFFEEEYNGNVSLRAKKFYPPKSGIAMKDVIEGPDAKAFAARWRDRVRSSDAARAAEAQQGDASFSPAPAGGPPPRGTSSAPPPARQQHRESTAPPARTATGTAPRWR